MSKSIDPDDVVLSREKIISRQFNRWRKQKKPSSYEELVKRLDLYFEFIQETESVPSLESLALAIGVSRTTLYRYCNGIGCNLAWHEAIVRAKQAVEAAVCEAGNNGKISPVLTIWQQKSYFGHRDNASLEEKAMTLNNTYAEHYSLPSRLLKKYLGADSNPVESTSEAHREPEALPSNGRWQIPEDAMEDNKFNEYNVPFYVKDDVNE